VFQGTDGTWFYEYNGTVCGGFATVTDAGMERRRVYDVGRKRALRARVAPPLAEEEAATDETRAEPPAGLSASWGVPPPAHEEVLLVDYSSNWGVAPWLAPS
jgi:hypothetical protein